MASEIIKVTAENGQVYEFSEKAKVKKISYLADDGSVVTRFVFRNGAVRQHITPPNSPTYGRMALHGGDQKFGDEFAGLDDVEDCIAAFEAMSERLTRGEWTEKRQSDGLAGTSLLARALAEVTGKSIDEVKAKLATTPKDVKAALAKQGKVAAIIYRLKAERDQRRGVQVDADAALAEFAA